MMNLQDGLAPGLHDGMSSLLQSGFIDSACKASYSCRARVRFSMKVGEQWMDVYEMSLDMRCGPPGMRFSPRLALGAETGADEDADAGTEAPFAVVIRRDRGCAWLISSLTKTYQELRPAPGSNAPVGGKSAEGGGASASAGGVGGNAPELIAQGEETVNGSKATLYALPMPGAQSNQQAKLWVRDDEIPAKVMVCTTTDPAGGTGSDVRMTLDFCDVVKGAHAPDAFDVPAGYERAPVPGAELGSDGSEQLVPEEAAEAKQYNVGELQKNMRLQRGIVRS